MGRATGPIDLVLPRRSHCEELFLYMHLGWYACICFPCAVGTKRELPLAESISPAAMGTFAGKVRVPMYRNQVKIDVADIGLPPSVSQRDYKALESEQPLGHLPVRVIVCDSVLPISLCFRLQSKT